MTIIPKSLGTHNGRFHADEVTACALLLLQGRIEKDKIFRTRDPQVLSRCEYVCDVGGIYNPQIKRFDHHQSDYQGLMSSAGMILQYLYEQGDVIEEEFHFLREALIKEVDDYDNGRVADPHICSFSVVVGNFLPIPYESTPEEETQSFYEALDFVLVFLKRLIGRFRELLKFRAKVKEAMKEQSHCLLFDESGPWLDNFFLLEGEKHPAQFVIMPAGEHWKLRGIPPNKEDLMNVRSPLPKEWAGLMEKELAEVTGISGAVFCHKGGFISIWKTREDALQALEKIYSLQKSKGERGL